jgi:serine/threonine-protein kinase
VGVLLEGTVRRAGGRLKITAHATNATDGSLIWSESYDVLASDVFKVQTDIASAIANALRLALTPLANADGAPRAPDPRAHDLYLQGRYALYKFTSSSIQEALAHFGRAIAIDPAYAEALAGIAGVWFYLAPDWESPEVAYPRARSAAQRAMAADSLLAESRVVWAASLLYNDWDLAGAEREARRAVVLDSLSADAHNLLGIILRARGRYEESRERTRRASELDPLIPQYLVNEAEAYQLEGRHIEALAVLQRATQVDSTYAFAHVRSAVSLMATGRYAGALQAAERGRAMRDRSRFAIAEILARSGRTAEAKVTLAELQSDGARRYVAADGIARIQLALGDKAGALASLERAFSEHSSGILWLASREFDPVRRDPRFVALTRGVRPRR